MKEYDHKKIEKKWQTIWEKSGIYHAKDDSKNKSKKQKFYGLIEFPYPSGSGLHVGHIRSNTAMDIISRKRRMEGYNVLYPIGWDAFGLPTENYAIKSGIHPIKVTKDNTDTFRKQLKALGFSFDWSREINTTDPKYYKWTQWIFLQFFKKGLAYKTRTEINWCPSCKIGLANEEVVGGMCERCGGATEKREKEQWMLAITKYADRLDKDLDTVDYLEKIKIQQRNWIGKSQGINLKCKVKDLDISFEVYDSVPQTFMAQTFTVIAPDHPLLKKLVSGTLKEKEVLAYAKKMVVDRQKKGDNYINEIDGIFTGRYVWYEPARRELPIWVASFAVMGYGSGMVNCSAHDERDYAFAKKFNIPLHEVAEALFVQTAGESAVRPDLPMVERNAISTIVKHWSEDKYLALKWKGISWITFVTGGIELGQTPEEAARSEVKEETGFTNLKLIKKLPNSHSQFYHLQKKENRFAHFHNFYFKLESGEQVERDEAEGKAKHEPPIWLTPKEIEKLITPPGQLRDFEIIQGKEKPIIKNGILAEPREFKGREWGEVREDIIDYIVKKGWGERKTNYKLRDWVFSRQRYWGEPIPLIHCEKCGFVPVPDKDLPVLLPKVKTYKPRDDGESPLAGIKSFVNTTCPTCGEKAKRETDTMPNWAGSSWYFLRYTDPKNNKEFASKENLKYWTPVNWYNGGMEHTTLHLLYSRFWHKFLYDLKLVSTSEPYAKRTSHGLILAEQGEKMSKSKGNVVNPDALIKTYGADTIRMYEMFMGPFDQAVSWSTDSMVGPRRFLERVWKMSYKVESYKVIKENQKLEKLLHQTIKKVSEDIEDMKFNTAISSLMIFVNEVEKNDFQLSTFNFKTFLQLLSPFAPHIAEELWQNLPPRRKTPPLKRGINSIHLSEWPTYDPLKIKDEQIKIVIQVNGKVRAEMMMQVDEDEESVKHRVFNTETVSKFIAGKPVKKTIYVKNRLINIVT